MFSLNSLKFFVFNTDYGNCVGINLPNNYKDVLMFDTGRSDYFHPYDFLKNLFGFERLSWLTITSLTEENLFGLPYLEQELPSSFEIRRDITLETLHNHAYIFKQKEVSDIQKYSLGFIKNYEYTAPSLTEENTYEFGEVEISQFKVPLKLTDSLYDLSLVHFISFAGWKVFLPSMMTRQGFDVLLEDQSFINNLKDTNILIAPIFGWYDGFNETLFKFLKPDLTIVHNKTPHLSSTEVYEEKTKGLRLAGDLGYKKILTTNELNHIMIEIPYNGHLKVQNFS